MINFGGSEIIYTYNESEIIIVPVPYDSTSTWIKGADKGPGAILEASCNLEFYDIETGTEAHRRGIFTLPPVAADSTPEAMVETVRERCQKIYNEKRFPVVIGGNHSVSIGAMKAASISYDDLTILQIDAHADLRQEYEGSPLNHACVMARAREMAPIVQVGIRSMSLDEIPYADRSRMFCAHELWSDNLLWDRALSLLTENVYLTIDLDGFDPGIMPSTGTPEPGGPHYRDIMNFLREVITGRNLVGFDIVELCPSPHNKAPDFMAARILYQILSYREFKASL
ncbi:MAG: agmatinase [Bacteroidales bacterium]|jgi:agmatinase|nr:agmatinase [Bacteroidales bacterium]